jgi:hypothetical protein
MHPPRQRRRALQFTGSVLSTGAKTHPQFVRTKEANSAVEIFVFIIVEYLKTGLKTMFHENFPEKALYIAFNNNLASCSKCFITNPDRNLLDGQIIAHRVAAK